MSSTYVPNINSIDDNQKELSRSKGTNFKIEAETLDTWISFNTYLNDLNFFSYVYSFMIYKIAKPQIQKSSNKGDMTKKPDLTQNPQKFITLTKQIFFFWILDNRSVL